jgi:hypothetical protein
MILVSHQRAIRLHDSGLLLINRNDFTLTLEISAVAVMKAVFNLGLLPTTQRNSWVGKEMPHPLPLRALRAQNI